MSTKKKFWNDRRFKHGSLSTVLTIGFVAVLVIVNVIASLLLERFPLNIDLTSDSRFTLTQESVDYVKGLTEPVSITVCLDEKTFESASEIYKQAYEIIKDYAKYNSNIKVNFVDLIKNPTFAQKYPNEQLADANIIVESGKRYKIFPSYDLFVEKTYDNNQTTYSSKAEQVMTSAIMYALDENPTTAISLDGASAGTGKSFIDLLSSNNYQIVEQTLLTDELNMDADVAILVAPQADLTDEALKKLDTFLDNGGKFGKSLIYFPGVQTPSLPKLDEFLKEWGIQVGTGIIAETNSQNAINNAFSVVNVLDNEDFTKKLKVPSNPFVTPYAHPINALWEASDNRTTTVLAKTSNTTIEYPADAGENFDIAGAEQQSFNTIVLGSRQKYIDNKNVTSNVLVFGSEMVVNQSYLQYKGFNNGDYSANIITKMMGKGEPITIVPIDFSSQSIAISDSAKAIYSILFSIAIPVIVLILGIVVWLRRRHL